MLACAVIGSCAIIFTVSVFINATVHYILIRAAYRFAYSIYAVETCFPVPFYRNGKCLTLNTELLHV